MFLALPLAPIEMSSSLNTQVVTFGGTRSKNDFFRAGLNKGGYLSSSFFDNSFGFPAVGVGSGVRIAIGSNLLQRFEVLVYNGDI
jgi:hypothetical protein